MLPENIRYEAKHYLKIENCFSIFLFLLPWSFLFFKKSDVWHAEGHFFQMGLLILFCASFFQKPNNWVSNKPLAYFLAWAGLVTGSIWIEVVAQTQKYPIKIFLPFFNLLCFVLFYKLSVEYLNREKIEKILRWLPYSILGVLFLCVLQKLNLDQFFKPLSVKSDELVGTIGNTSHLAGYLTLCQPLFFNRGFFGHLSLILLWIVLFLCNSASGIIVGIIVLLFWLLMKKKYLWSLIGNAYNSQRLYPFVLWW